MKPEECGLLHPDGYSLPLGGAGGGPKKGQPLFRETARIRFLELEWITHLVRLRQKGKRQHKFHNQRSYQDR